MAVIVRGSLTSGLLVLALRTGLRADRLGGGPAALTAGAGAASG